MLPEDVTRAPRAVDCRAGFWFGRYLVHGPSWDGSLGSAARSFMVPRLSLLHCMVEPQAGSLTLQTTSTIGNYDSEGDYNPGGIVDPFGILFASVRPGKCQAYLASIPALW